MNLPARLRCLAAQISANLKTRPRDANTLLEAADWIESNTYGDVPIGMLIAEVEASLPKRLDERARIAEGRS